MIEVHWETVDARIIYTVRESSVHGSLKLRSNKMFPENDLTEFLWWLLVILGLHSLIHLK